MNVLDCHFSVPKLIVDGQSDELILGSHVVKHLIRALKASGDFWEIVSLSDQQLLATVEKWRGSQVPGNVDTVKHAVTLEPMTERLVWGHLPSHKYLSAGSTVSVESTIRVPRTVMVGQIVTPLWHDRWVPVRVINPSNKPVTLKYNCKDLMDGSTDIPSPSKI